MDPLALALLPGIGPKRLLEVLKAEDPLGFLRERFPEAWRHLPEAEAQGERFTVAFMAPPYAMDLAALFGELLASGLVEAGGLYVLQHPKDLYLPLGERRVYGENALTLVEV